MSSLSFPRPAEIHGPPRLPKYAYPGVPVQISSVYPPPEPLPRPDLPTPQRKPIWDGDTRIPYNLSTHIVPAAYHREDSDVELPGLLPSDGSMSKEERKAFVQKSEATLREIRRTYEETGYKPQQKLLWLCLNRYYRTSDVKGGYTLFCAHANGFHKAEWEPTILSLLSSPETQSLVQELWVWDVVSHGDSALLNKGKLTTMMYTRTVARDLLTFLTHFLPTSFSSAPLPVHLDRVPQPEVERRLRSGFLGSDSPRLPICAFGHSFGGAVSPMAALSHPSLFASLFLVDPVILYPTVDIFYVPHFLALGALSRRAVWKTREEARKGFLQSPFFRAWDPRVLELYVEAGLYQDEDGLIRLKTSPVQEAIIFNDAEIGAPEVWTRLHRQELDPRIKLRWAMHGPGHPQLDARPNATQHRVWLRPENSSHFVVEDCSHLIVHEKPEVLGKEMEKYLKEISTAETRARL
ncbi:Alpha/Beta hydrolase protein [Rhodocollybia butyracea]|uniref:Alpha/Beta hydrolase protein n=1 Tax=Rhodocollybia butyracea TaxID=206335 RepID=A0A9P5U8A0_9AGAR|nr:Alpha/Beta hydrolase protein [Rhodocollybia butyracea]